MRKVLSFSGFLMLGLVVSQFLPMMAGDGYGAVKSISNVLLYHDKCGAGVRNG